jgi:hypothetical protein
MRSQKASPIIGILLTIAVFAVVGVSLSASPQQDKPTYKTTGNEAAMVGRISFVGAPREPRRIDMSADPICDKANSEPTTDWVVVSDQKLANVFVYVRGESLNAYSFEAPPPDAALEHKRCRYEPHVLGMQTQQTLKIINSDLTTHNTHVTPKSNPDWNQSQPAASAPLELRFARPEVFIPIRDNQHPWEKAYIGVFSHPFFSVSSTDGSYKISGLPPGQYTVVAWHEQFGEQTVDLFLTAGEQKSLDFIFKAIDH